MDVYGRRFLHSIWVHGDDAVIQAFYQRGVGTTYFSRLKTIASRTEMIIIETLMSCLLS
jgi:hypothetical protein